MKRLTLLVLLSMIASAALWAQKPVVKVGVNMGLSGNSESGYFQPVKKAFLLAEKELNARPKAPYEYKVIFEDNMWTPRGSVLATERLISLEKVDAVIVLADYAFGPTTPIAKRNHVANLAIAWGADKADGKYNFLLGTNEISYARAFYSVVKDSPLKIGILAVNQSAVPAFVDEMQRQAKVDGKEPFPVTLINSESVDFHTVILKLQKQERIQQLVLILYGDDLNKFLYQLKQSDYRPAFVTMVDGVDNIPERKLLMTGGAIVAIDAMPNPDFQKRFKEYAKENPNAWTGFGYDCLSLIANSLESAPTSKEPTHVRIAKALEQRKEFSGVSGSYVQEKGVFETTPELYHLTSDGTQRITVE